MQMTAQPQMRMFSKYFEELDKASFEDIDATYMHNKEYLRLMNHWKAPLEKKRLRRLRKEANPPEIVPPAENPDGVLTVHDAQQGVTLPPHPYKIFAVVNVKGMQMRVIKDTRVLIEDLGEDYSVGQQIVLEDVLMVGTADYTCLGRPSVGNARVLATIEEKTRSTKAIIFKKRRRKGYQKSQGHKQTMMVLRIDQVEHNIDETDLERMQQQGDLKLQEASDLQGYFRDH
uniref:Large ribosomal subunit protein bL21m n=1 Tax=Strombidium inclinatum TaxID=197538 RepID=A0A7S3IKI9_9SPIT